jgi:hypothetical protein
MLFRRCALHSSGGPGCGIPAAAAGAATASRAATANNTIEPIFDTIYLQLDVVSSAARLPI